MSNELSILQTADQLFARPECVHIITMNNPNQNLHLERTPAGFRYTPGTQERSENDSRAFASLEDLYREFASLEDLYRKVTTHSALMRGAIWLDISAYPAFPYTALYLPLAGPVELHIQPDSEQITAHGPHIVYGPVEISAPLPNSYVLTPPDNWLVVEYPAVTLRGGVRGILRPTHGVLDRLRLTMENRRLQREDNVSVVRPAATVIYGKPPADWQNIRQSLIPLSII
jgi:hypothetical protein